jgi:superfamily II DNA helicase RecQ
MSENSAGPDPSLEQLREATKRTFGQIPCFWQLEVAAAILKHDKDVIAIAATGSGKTLTFWIPLLVNTDGIQIICAPLNILGTINVRDLAKHGIRAITVTAENASVATFRVNSKIPPDSYH